jgi:hypothetical protein
LDSFTLDSFTLDSFTLDSFTLDSFTLDFWRWAPAALPARFGPSSLG